MRVGTPRGSETSGQSSPAPLAPLCHQEASWGFRGAGAIQDSRYPAPRRKVEANDLALVLHPAGRCLSALAASHQPAAESLEGCHLDPFHAALSRKSADCPGSPHPSR